MYTRFSIFKKSNFSPVLNFLDQTVQFGLGFKTLVRRRDLNINNTQDQAFVTENKSIGKNRGPNDWKFNGRLQSRDRSQFKETRECFHCGKICHLRRDC